MQRFKNIIFRFKIKRKMKVCLSYFNPFKTKIDGGDNIEIMEKVNIYQGGWVASFGGKIFIDCNTSIGRNSHIISTKGIHIGKSVLIAERVYISDNLHGYEDINIPIKDQPLRQLKEVFIGEGSWIGENVCIIGATIGRNSVVGANSVVTKDIPDYCVAVGAPAKVIKKFNIESNKWEKVIYD